MTDESKKASIRDWLGFIPLVAAVVVIGGFSIWQAFGRSTAGFIDPVPTVDYAGLDAGGRDKATRLMNEQVCGCGCGMTVARCRRDDPTCGYSPITAKKIVEGVKAGLPEAEIRAAADKITGEITEDVIKEDPTVTPRVKFDSGDLPSVGSESAPVTLVEFIDYQCPFCERAHATIESLRKKYGAKLRVRFVQNPLEMHPDAPLAAEAALAAGEQGKFLEMHNRLLANRDRLGRKDLVEHARALGLDAATFSKALDASRFKARVQENLKLAERLGINGTPYFFVNGRPLSGARPKEQFEKIIDEELAGTAKPTKWLESSALEQK